MFIGLMVRVGFSRLPSSRILVRVLVGVLVLFVLAAAGLAQEPGRGALPQHASHKSGTASTISTAAAALPRVLMLIDPGNASPSGASYGVFKSIAADLAARGVSLVNPTFNPGIQLAANQRAKASTPRDAASKLGLSYQAALVVSFSCNTLKMGFGGNLDQPYTCRATVSGYVLEAASGKPVKRMIAVHQLGNGRDDETAERAAVAPAAKAFASEAFKMLNAWAHRREAQGDPFLIRFLAAHDYEQVSKLRSILQNIPRCSSVMQKSISMGDPRVENFAEISFEYRGSEEQFCRALASVLSGGSGGLTADVTSKGNNLVEVRLSERMKKDALKDK